MDWKHLSASEQEAKLLEEIGVKKMAGTPRGCIIKNLHLNQVVRFVPASD